MMQNVGLEASRTHFDLDTYLPEEIEHFNAYALSGMLRKYSLRLIGMMYATEFLVPRQLAAVIAGWRRVGLHDSKIEYLLTHFEGDVEHANGWADRVIIPSISRDPSVAGEIFLGVLQHLDILGRLYDNLLAKYTGTSVLPITGIPLKASDC
jgi:hypothetical protein